MTISDNLAGRGLLNAGFHEENGRAGYTSSSLDKDTVLADVLTDRDQGIILKGIGLSYGAGTAQADALQGIDMKIAPGEFVVVLGPSGCGKTSLLNIIAGYQRPTQGSLSISGKLHTKPDSRVGVVFQQANLFPWLSLARNIEFGMRMKNIPKAERRERVAYFLEMMGLAASGGLLPHQLSGGMKQRAAIARTLATEPDIVLLDEPFSALDALTRENMQVHLREIWRKTGKSLFFITHDVDEALLLSSRLVVMHPGPGRIVEDFGNPLNSGGEAERSFADIRASREYSDLRQFLLSRMTTAP